LIKKDPPVTAQVGTPATPTVSAPTGAAPQAPTVVTPQSDSKDKNTNVVGALSENARVKNEPHKIENCLQVLEIPGKRLKDPSDFTSKKDAFFTMSGYMLNMFEEKDNTTLLESIDLSNVTSMPRFMEGSVSCVYFSDNANRIIPMCLSDTDHAKKMIQIFENFLKCRSGDSLQPPSLIEIRNQLKQSCLGIDIDFDLSKFGKDEESAKKAIFESFNMAMISANHKLRKELNGPSLPSISSVTATSSNIPSMASQSTPSSSIVNQTTPIIPDTPTAALPSNPTPATS
jgi:hypothetical protein